jgi:DNA invertase Pin-like site-specific DNA recombinase
VLGVPYSRVSSSAQVGGRGLERQAADPASYCQQRGWQLYEGPGYTDAGVSGFSGQNLAAGALGRFLGDVKAGRFGVEPVALLVEDLDRFSRQHALSILPVLVDDILNAGITIAVMGKGRDISRKTAKANPMELHELLFWLSGSHEFSAKLSRRLEDVHAADRERIRKGEPVRPSSAPAWLSLVDGKWELNDYATVIRRILAMAGDGIGCQQIAVTLNREGIPSPGQRRRDQWAQDAKRRSRESYEPVLWSSASVRQVIVSPAVIGDRQIVTPGFKERVREWQESCAQLARKGVSKERMPRGPARTYEQAQKGYYPALLSEAEHGAIMLAMERRRVSEKGRIDQCRWIGMRHTFCTCGALIGASTAVRRRKTGTDKTWWLRCKGRTRGTACKAPQISLSDVQAHLLTRLSEESFMAMLEGDSGVNTSTELAAAMARRASAQASLDQTDAALRAGEQALAAEVDPSVLGVLARRQAGLEERRREAAAGLAVAQAEVARVQSRQPSTAAGAELQEAVCGLLQKFAEGNDEPADRMLLNRHISGLGLRITVDTQQKRIGLATGDGEPRWQPLASGVAHRALERGRAGTTYLSAKITLSDLQRAAEQARLAGADGFWVPADFYGQLDFENGADGLEFRGDVQLHGE